MKNVLILFDSVHGQTQKIASHLQCQLEHMGIASKLIRASDPNQVSPLDLEQFDAVLAGCPVYASRFLSPFVSLLKTHRELIQAKPLALFTVSLNAADQHRSARTADMNLLKKLMDLTGIKPQYLASFSGSLMYREYNWLVRLFLRRIARKAGGGTDTTQNYEYTDWQQVNDFLLAFVEDNRNSEFAINRRMSQNLLRSFSNASFSAEPSQ